jgi:hypothetical protein
MSAATGIVLSNILGGILFEFFGNRITCDIFCLTSLSMAIIVFLFNIKPGYILTLTKQETMVPRGEDKPPLSKKLEYLELTRKNYALTNPNNVPGHLITP